MDILRLFWDTVDFSDHSSIGWEMTLRLAMFGHETCPTCDIDELFQWFVHFFFETMRDEYTESMCKPTLLWLQLRYSKGSLPVWLKIGPKDAIDIRMYDWTILHYRMLWLSRTAGEDVMGLVEALQCSASPNCAGKYQGASPLSESPTSLSMYSQYSFNNWLFALREVGDQAYDVFKTELEQGILYETGWSTEACQKLVDWQAGKRAGPIRMYCKLCGRYLLNLLILQPTWIYSLAQIKNGEHPEGTEWTLLENSKTPKNGISDSTEVFRTHQEPCSNSTSEVEPADRTQPAGEKRNFVLDPKILFALHTRYSTKRQTIPALHTLTAEPPPENDDGQEQSPAVEFADCILDAWASLRNEDVVCMGCWLRTFLNIEPKDVGYEGEYSGEDGDVDSETDEKQEKDTDADTFSEDDSFSPFLIHS